MRARDTENTIAHHHALADARAHHGAPVAAREQSGTDTGAALLRLPGVYEIVHLATGRRYIGSARHLRNRWAEHRKALRKRSHKNGPLQAAWNKYGEEAFAFRPLAVLEKCETLSTEQRLLNAARDSGERIYNIAIDVTSGMKGRSHSAETRAILSAKHKVWHSDPEVQRQIREIKAAHGADPAVRARMSMGLKKYFADPAARRANAERQRVAQGTQEARAAARAVQLQRLREDPDLGRRHADAMRKHYSDPTVRAAHADRMRAFYQTAEGRAALIATAETRRRKKAAGVTNGRT